MWPVDALSEPVWQRLSWTLLHFLWQGLCVAVLLAVVLPWFRAPQARARYAVCMIAMVVMAACPLVTFLVMDAGVPRDTAEVGPNTADVRSDAADVGWDAAQRSPTMARKHTGLPSSTSGARPEGVASLEPAGSDEIVGSDGLAVSETPAAQQQDVGPRPTLQLRRHLRDSARAVQPYLLIGWIAGVLLCSARLLLGQVGAQWIRRGRRPIHSALASRVAEFAERLGLRSVPRVFSSERICEAIVVGFLRPMVLLPACWLTEMTPDVLEAVIAHELAHIRRWDLWVNLFQRLMETLLFYHPAVWWLSRRVRLEREMCCDELAVAATGERVNYANVLELVARKRLAATRPGLGVAMGGEQMTLLNRVRNVLGISPSHERARWWPVGLLALLLLLAVWWASMSVSPFGQGGALAGEEKTPAETPQATMMPAETKPQQKAPAETDATEPYRVKPFDLLTIKVIGTLPDQPIDQVYLVEPSGRVALGPAYGRVELKGLTLEEAESTIEKHLLRVLRDPKVQVTSAGRVTRWRRALLPKAPYQIRPMDKLTIRVAGTLADQPIDGTYSVEPSGQVPLGPAYGRVALKELTLQEAEEAIEKHLKKFLTHPEVSVMMAGWKTVWRHAGVPKPPYRIARADLLEIDVVGAFVEQPIAGTHVVEPSGQVALGPPYGRVELKGLTLEEAEDAIEKHLKRVLVQPEVSVTLAGWKTDEKDEQEKSVSSLDKDLTQLEHQVALLNEQERVLAADVERQKEKVQEIGGKSIDIRMLRRDIESDEGILSAISTEMEALKAQPGEGSAKAEIERKQRLEKLDKAFATTEEEVRKKRNELKTLAKQVGTSDAETLSRAQELELRKYDKLQREQIKVSFELRRAEAELEARKALLEKINDGRAEPEIHVEPKNLLPQQYRTIGRLLVDQVVLIKHWEAFETNEKFLPFVKDLHQRLTTQDYESRLILPKSPKKKHQPEDQFEKQLLERFLKAKPDKTAGEAEFAERLVPGRNEYQYYQPIRAQASCLRVCHRPPPGRAGEGLQDPAQGAATTAPLAEGDLMAVVRVALPMRPRRSSGSIGQK